eukprot:Polyplicarium_translucidae@DN3416_c0_g1_i1.p1
MKTWLVIIGWLGLATGDFVDPDNLFTFNNEIERTEFVRIATRGRTDLLEALPAALPRRGRALRAGVDAFVPEIACQLSRRVGGAVDGGKWICDPFTLLKEDCLIYSFGSNDDWTFEKELLAIQPHCEIHTFDHTVDTITSKPTNVTYHRLGLGAADRRTTSPSMPLKSLPNIIRSLKHERRRIDILKVDIEGAEFEALTPLLASERWALLPPVRQISIEVHRDWKRAAELLAGFAGQGFFMHAMEPNLNARRTFLREYSLLWLPRLMDEVCKEQNCLPLGRLMLKEA